MPGRCHGNGEDHCCYQEGNVCPFLEMFTVPGRRWVCGLARKYKGDWDKVHNDEGYLKLVKPYWIRNNVKDCGDFGPEEQQCCWGQYKPTSFVSSTTILPKQGEGVFFETKGLEE